MAEKQIVCDNCGEQWEESFFCEICSHGGHHEMQEVPNIMWDGHPKDEYVWEEVWIDNGDICLNCCNGHPRSPTQLAHDAGESAVSTSSSHALAESTSQKEHAPTQRV